LIELPYFLDSNVIIGYCFYDGDHWGKAAYRVIHDSEEKHSSTCVKHECFGSNTKCGRCKDIRDEIADEFLLALDFLQREGDAGELYLIVVDDKYRIREIIEDIYRESGENVASMVQLLRIKMHQYEFECKKREKEIQTDGRIIYHPSSPQTHQLSAILSNHVSNLSDVRILIDAHEIGCFVMELVFITGDYKDIVKNRDKILPSVNLSAIRGLGSF
jgi:hypothetical protein